MKARTKSALLPCSQVLGIQDLQDPIRAFFSFQDFKALTRVCRYWKSLFEPYVWRCLALSKDSYMDRVLKRYSIHLDQLRRDYVHEGVLGSVIKFCPHITLLSLHLDGNSTRVTYTGLEKLFAQLNSRLTNLDIRFDISLFDPVLFWTLGHLSNLSHLQLQPYSIGNPDLLYS
ncbi:hypothetical protein BGX33_004038 [Mortierella sp. NVP41]|nr:hypothetical protein BGX33_004038 [Mortierella sp. NVP41]